MNKFIIKHFNTCKWKKIIIAITILLVVGTSTFSQTPMNDNQMSKMNNDSILKTGMVHPFYTHMGMPQAVGRYNLRFSSTLTQNEGKSNVDFDLQFETGLTKNAGVWIRLESEETEIKFQYLALRSKNGMNAFSPLIQFEIPTHEGIYTLLGFSSTLSNARVAFHQVILYGLREKNIEGSVALVYKLSKSVFLIAESLGEKKQDEPGVVTILGGIKVRINSHLLLGLGVHLPVTENREFSSQYVFQPELQLKH